jgi:hypothetical protein
MGCSSSDEWSGLELEVPALKSVPVAVMQRGSKGDEKKESRAYLGNEWVTKPVHTAVLRCKLGKQWESVWWLDVVEGEVPW